MQNHSMVKSGSSCEPLRTEPALPTLNANQQVNHIYVNQIPHPVAVVLILTFSKEEREEKTQREREKKRKGGPEGRVKRKKKQKKK